MTDEMLPLKVRCNTWVESKKVQCALAERFGASWGSGIEIPWQPKSKLLLVLIPWPRGNFLAWMSPEDYEKCDFPGYEAKELLGNLRQLEAL